jgi:hypothetical protein
MHSVHLPFQCSKVYRLHINYHMTKKKIRIILLILDFKLGTVDNQKDYLQTWENSSFSLLLLLLLFFFFIKQLWTQKCAVQRASVEVNISYY